ncbi:MAG TPA: VWA domain-containing protein, partial [Blastocatellia bacterium]|nr:VWA domain-containing protein [Blastocatellia bacterium]
MKKIAVMFLTSALVTTGLAQDQSKPARQNEKAAGAVQIVEVLLDVVVKDKRGRAVTDLSAADFEIFEDGAKQPVESFRLITRNSTGESGRVDSAVPETASAPANATPSSPAKPVPASNSDPGASVVAIVFDRLSQDARKRAHDAAMSYVGGDSGLNNFVGVFAINLSVSTVQNYTTDIGLVKKAIEKAGGMAPASFESKTIDSGSAIAAGQR